ncbi:hypothetical protein GDO81_024742 [Engystomops pustulosus]|uniref:Uncharacterized protein n=1 Tax=Engystomops pustulosus TaxID=76066 RepID=A0AAV6ZQ70_ENGPU|nr:hypothetical protein GDO81_024742 [Engystomops pustulosus]
MQQISGMPLHLYGLPKDYNQGSYSLRQALHKDLQRSLTPGLPSKTSLTLRVYRIQYAWTLLDVSWRPTRISDRKSPARLHGTAVF